MNDFIHINDHDAIADKVIEQMKTGRNALITGHLMTVLGAVKRGKMIAAMEKLEAGNAE